jgi:hypothetical protein
MRIRSTDTISSKESMRRLAVLLSGLVVLLVLGGCSLLPRRDLAFDTSLMTTSSVDAPGSSTGRSLAASAITQTVLASGSTVTLASGLTLAVPKGWTGTLTRDDAMKPQLPGALGARNASELLVLQQGPPGHVVRISSSPDAEARWLGESTYRPVLASAVSTAFEVAFGPAGIGPRLAVVRTHAPGAKFGLMVFVHTGGSTAKSVEGVWRVFKIKGVAPPLLPAVKP